MLSVHLGLSTSRKRWVLGQLHTAGEGPAQQSADRDTGRTRQAPRVGTDDCLDRGSSYADGRIRETVATRPGVEPQQMPKCRHTGRWAATLPANKTKCQKYPTRSHWESAWEQARSQGTGHEGGLPGRTSLVGCGGQTRQEEGLKHKPGDGTRIGKQRRGRQQRARATLSEHCCPSSHRCEPSKLNGTCWGHRSVTVGAGQRPGKPPATCVTPPKPQFPLRCWEDPWSLCQTNAVWSP